MSNNAHFTEVAHIGTYALAGMQTETAHIAGYALPVGQRLVASGIVVSVESVYGEEIVDGDRRGRNIA
jgi:hypothetical protein